MTPRTTIMRASIAILVLSVGALGIYMIDSVYKTRSQRGSNPLAIEDECVSEDSNECDGRNGDNVVIEDPCELNGTSPCRVARIHSVVEEVIINPPRAFISIPRLGAASIAISCGILMYATLCGGFSEREPYPATQESELKSEL